MATYESKKYTHTGSGLTGIAATAVADGSVTNAEYQFINTLSSNAQTQITANLPKAGGTMTGGIVFPDDTGPAPAKISMGAGTDMKIYSDGTSGLIVGNAMELQTTTGDKYMTFASGGNINVPDSRKLTFGGSDDLKIYHDTSNSVIADSGTGGLQCLSNEFKVMNAAGDANQVIATESGSVELYHNGNKKAETVSGGLTITGTATATTVSAPTGSFTNVSGNGSSLTSLNASNLASGTVPDARLPASALSSDFVKLSRVSGTGVSSIGFLGSPSGFSGDYRHYKVILDGKWQNANNASTYIGMRISDDATNYSSSSIYSSSQIFGMTNANNWTFTYQGSVFYINRWPPYSTQGSRSAACEITIFGANEASHKTVSALGGSWDRNQNGASWQSSGGVIETTGTITGIQLFMTDGANITGPSAATLYGIK